MAANPGSEAPGIVQVKITLAQEGPRYQEVIKLRTKNHEVVEVDGFHFRRKRKNVTPSPVPPSATSRPRCSPAAVKSSVQLEDITNSPAAAAVTRAASASDTPGKPAAAGATPVQQAVDDVVMTEQRSDPEEQEVAGEAVQEPAADDQQQQQQQQAEGEAVAAAADGDAGTAEDGPVDEADADMDAVLDDGVGDGQQQLEEEEQEEEEQEDVDDMVPATPAEPEPLEFSMAPSELCYLVQWVLTSGLRRLPGMSGESAEAAAADIAEQFAEQLQQPGGALAPAPAPAAAAGGGETGAGQPDTGETQTAEQAAAGDAVGAQATDADALAQSVLLLPYQVQQLKAALQEKLDRLTQEEAAWLQLMQQYTGLADAGGSGEATAAAAAAAEATADGQQAAVVELPQSQGNYGAAVSAAVADEAEAAAGVTVDPAEPTGSRTATEQQQEEAKEEEQEEDLALSREHAGILRGVALKVEMLTALVEKMEQIVSTAEAAARSLQATYHAEKFKVFPHVNSPATLIRSIIASQRSEGGGGGGSGSSGAGGSAENPAVDGGANS